MKRTKIIFSLLLAFTMSLTMLSGCGKIDNNTKVLANEGGSITLKVNPEISINYDKNGVVTEITAKNEDAKEILKHYKLSKNQNCKDVIADLVYVIGHAGYFVEDIDHNTKKITLEFEEGSQIPYDEFIAELVEEISECVNENKWNSKIDIESKDHDEWDDIYDDLDDDDMDDVDDDLDDDDMDDVDDDLDDDDMDDADDDLDDDDMDDVDDDLDDDDMDDADDDLDDDDMDDVDDDFDDDIDDVEDDLDDDDIDDLED